MSDFSFDPIATAKEVIGNLTDSIKATPRDASVSEVQGRATFNSALLLQAGLRALLPVSEREGVALPRIFPNDPPALQDAQRNYEAVFASGGEASPEQKSLGLRAVAQASKELVAQGYQSFPAALDRFVASQTASTPAPIRSRPGKAPSP